MTIDRVEWVNYAGFPDSPYYELAQKYLGNRACSLMTVGIKGGLQAAVKFYDALKLIKRLVNLGDAKSLACHPASTTHRQMSAEEQRSAGVVPEMIRLSIGIEHIDDIIARFETGTRCSHAWSRRRETLMPVFFDSDASLSSFQSTASRIGLINNMSDEALKATERQYISLLDSASDGMQIQFVFLHVAGCSPQ